MLFLDLGIGQKYFDDRLVHSNKGGWCFIENFHNQLALFKATRVWSDYTILVDRPVRILAA